MKILLVEDNKDIANNIKQYLELEWNSVALSHHWEEGMEIWMHRTFDIILLDVMLPWISGIQIARKLKWSKDTPIIMITARDSVDDKIIGLEAGADDYIVKPFDLRELSARINTVTRRITNQTLEFEGWLSINMKNRKFIREWNNITLTQKEFLILEMLINKKWQPVSRTDIIEYIWWGEAIWESDAKLDVYISNIRSKLWKTLINTVKGYWYEVN